MPRRRPHPFEEDYEIDELLDDIAWDLFEFNYRDLNLDEKMEVMKVVGNVINAQEFDYGELGPGDKAELFTRA
jgi:hypothetical protein